jgi:hypothetical protein
MALIAPIAPSLNGQEITASDTAAAATDTFERRQGDCVLVVNNGSGAPINVTIVSHATPDAGEASADKVVAVPAGKRYMIGPFPQQFEDASGIVTVNFSATATVTRWVLDQS